MFLCHKFLNLTNFIYIWDYFERSVSEYVIESKLIYQVFIIKCHVNSFEGLIYQLNFSIYIIIYFNTVQQCFVVFFYMNNHSFKAAITFFYRVHFPLTLHPLNGSTSHWVSNTSWKILVSTKNYRIIIFLSEIKFLKSLEKILLFFEQ